MEIGQDAASGGEDEPERFASIEPYGDVGDQERCLTLELSPADVAALKRVLVSLEMRHPAATGIEKQVARAMFQSRRTRARLFPAAMFNEPAWDMLLAVYIADDAPTAAELARRTNTPLSTAMRWIIYLEVHRLIARESCADDRRAHVISLTDRGRSQLEMFLSDFAEQWR
jgi:DNA-binding MarR family transcriptional regulator